MKIGILSKNYAAKRLFLNKVNGAEYRDIRYNNYFIWRYSHLWFLKVIGKLRMTPEETASKLFYRYQSVWPTRCDVYHFFNTINYGKKKWVLSVESGVPWTLEVSKCVEDKNADLESIKLNHRVIKEISKIASPDCLGLLALSECSRNIQLEILKQFPMYREAIEKKLKTLHPAQELIVSSIEEKGIDFDEKELTFIYVGRDYFRKGGRETVEVLAKLRKKYNFRLILISDLRIDEPKYLRTNHDLEAAKNLIDENRSWIEYYDFLPNNQVLEKIKKSHVAFLPTWMDTYGYSILECQACGTPVVSTSLRALTETNNLDCGWLIKVPVNNLNNPIHNTKEEQDEFYHMLVDGLENIVVDILEHREIIKVKSEECLKRIAKKHSPEEYNRKLKLVYEGRICEL